MPLDGIRICDFCWAWAGTSATELLGFLGAEVIKVESWQRLDGVRTRVYKGVDIPQPNMSATFNSLNLGKLGVTVNLKQPRGVELIKDIVRVSDAVTNNFAGGVMDRMGLGYEALAEVRPDIILLSMPGFGHSGPWMGYHGYAPTFEDLSGITSMTGYPDTRPCRTGMGGYTDFVNGMQAVFSLVAALHHRRRSGEGQFIDSAQLESTSCLIGESFLDFAMNGRSAGRRGNRDAFMAPHNCYPCRGEDKWVSIAVANEVEWAALCEAAGKPEWLRDPRFAGATLRKENEKELDELVAGWSRGHTQHEVMQALQGQGVAAVPSYDLEGLVSDPHIRARGCFIQAEHPEAGMNTFVSPPWRLSGSPARAARPAPMVGEHNEQVFLELLGMPVEEFATLVAEQVIY